MEHPLEIVFEGMDPSDAVRTRIEKEADKLERFHQRITSCRVAITAPDKHKSKGGLFSVRIHITLPGNQEVNVRRNPDNNHAHEDAYVAIRDAFNAARRQLQDRDRKLEGFVKHHEGQPHGAIARLFYFEGYGFIEGEDGSDIFFDKHAVVDADFDKLEPGQKVRYVAVSGDKGPQASTVHVIG
ncbi:MAG TPA: 30S ribosomal protein S30 [Alphaproteobacteria bacterium]|nr:30S ribosomal protein S30 [Alphaproteobacteria bacterium]HBA41475.1 30S ribosomal protein S30 [Alphaproteobacteria bacterium]HBC53172.1 30S ribosomal protein S30 [Alphaproteobacteria bacterium]HCO90448.1 30S ribosomal protein S30 [Alphaproteobacteria bacterium]